MRPRGLAGERALAQGGLQTLLGLPVKQGGQVLDYHRGRPVGDHGADARRLLETSGPGSVARPFHGDGTMDVTTTDKKAPAKDSLPEHVAEAIDSLLWYLW